MRRLHTIYLICDRVTGDVHFPWFYTRAGARAYVRKKKTEMGRLFEGRVVKYVPDQRRTPRAKDPR